MNQVMKRFLERNPNYMKEYQKKYNLQYYLIHKEEIKKHQSEQRREVI